MANEHVGAKQEIAFKVEATRGTAVDPVSGDWFPHTGQGFIPKVEYVTDDSAIGRIEDVLTEEISKEYSQGSVSMKLYDNFLTPLNRMIFGAAGSVVSAVTTYSLTNTNLHNSYTITTSDPVTGDKKYALGMLNTATINVAEGDFANVSMEFIGGKEASSSVTPGYSTVASLFRRCNVTVGYADNYAGLSSPTTLTTKVINLNIEKNVEIDWANGSCEPDEITNGRFGVNGDFTVTYDSSDMRTLALAGTQKALIITLTNDAWKWEIKFPSVVFKDWNRDADTSGIVTQTFGFKPNYNDSTNGLIVGVVTDLS